MISARVATAFGIAIGAGGLAIYAAANLPVEIGAATVAIILASVGGAGYYFERIPVDGRADPSEESEPETTPLSARRIEVALRGGPLEREGLLLLLDSLERSSSHPDPPAIPADELRRVTHLSRSDFRSYVVARLDRIEGGERG